MPRSAKIEKLNFPVQYLEELNKHSKIKNQKIILTKEQQEFIKYARNNGYSMRNIGKVLGISDTTVSRFLNN